MGENGAGKSTLMKILYGMQPADSGEIIYAGKKVKFSDPGEAIQAGIGMVHQEIMLVPQYTVWENVVLGIEPVKFLDRLDTKKARQLVKEKIAEFSFNLDPDAKVEDISIAARQKVEILKLLIRNVSVLIMDEPTSVLTPQEIPQLFDELNGCAITTTPSCLFPTTWMRCWTFPTGSPCCARERKWARSMQRRSPRPVFRR